MKIRQLIEQLEEIEKIVSGSPHPNTDNVILSVEFVDPILDEQYWEAVITSVDYDNRIGCACEENCIISVQVEKICE